MINYKTGDILTEEADAIVNSVNCVGVMGRGLALQFKRAHPANFKAYASACKKGLVEPGVMFVFTTNMLRPKYIINFPTKRHWRGKSRVDDIQSGLVALVREVKFRCIKSIAIPPLGSGLGGLQWELVRPMIEEVFSGLEGVNVTIYEPWTTPVEVSASRASQVPRMTPGRAALVGLMERYLAGLMDPFVSLLEVHKLMYFMQESGESLKLKIIKGHYGPYAENLRHVLKAIEGHMVSGYQDGGDDPKKPLQLVPGASKDARAALESATETLQRFERVADLVDGFETPFGMELLSTVHWVLHNSPGMGSPALVNEVHAWHPRKKQFMPDQIELARDHLQSKRWLSHDLGHEPS